jgi:hypothetical protein
MGVIDKFIDRWYSADSSPPKFLWAAEVAPARHTRCNATHQPEVTGQPRGSPILRRTAPSEEKQVGHSEGSVRLVIRPRNKSGSAIALAPNQHRWLGRVG